MANERAAKIRRLARTRKILKEVVRELNRGNRELWHILTALRGPDSGNKQLKDYTTARIRAVIGMMYSGMSSKNDEHEQTFASVNPAPLAGEERFERNKLLERGHFRLHFLRAQEAIELVYGYDIFDERLPFTDAPTGFDIPNRNVVRGPWKPKRAR
jgi:hypothetical protein